MSLKTGIYAGIFAIPLLAVTIFLGGKPYYNWDMFPYMALAMEDDAIPFDSIHARVYRQAQASMSQQDFDAISSRQPELRSDPVAFRQILRYFNIKPLYIETIRIFHDSRVSALTATYLPSVLCYFLAGCLMFWWLSGSLPLLASCTVAWLTMALPFLVDAGRLSSPDMFCAFALLAGAYLLMEVSFAVGFVMCWMSVLIRPDAAILTILMTVGLSRVSHISAGAVLLFSMAGIIMTVLLAGPLIPELLFTDADYSPRWNVSEWIRNYLSGFIHGLRTLYTTYVVPFALAALATIYYRVKAMGRSFWYDPWSLLLAAVLISIDVRYFLHPTLEDRFLLAGYMITIVGACKTFYDFLLPRTSPG